MTLKISFFKERAVISELLCFICVASPEINSLYFTLATEIDRWLRFWLHGNDKRYQCNVEKIHSVPKIVTFNDLQRYDFRFVQHDISARKFTSTSTLDLSLSQNQSLEYIFSILCKYCIYEGRNPWYTQHVSDANTYLILEFFVFKCEEVVQIVPLDILCNVQSIKDNGQNFQTTTLS